MNSLLEIIKYSLPTVIGALIAWMTTMNASKTKYKHEKQEYLRFERKETYLKAFVLIDPILYDESLYKNDEYYNSICNIKAPLCMVSSNNVEEKFFNFARYIFNCRTGLEDFKYDECKQKIHAVLIEMKSDLYG